MHGVQGHAYTQFLKSLFTKLFILNIAAVYRDIVTLMTAITKMLDMKAREVKNIYI